LEKHWKKIEQHGAFPKTGWSNLTQLLLDIMYSLSLHPVNPVNPVNPMNPVHSIDTDKMKGPFFGGLGYFS